HAEGDVAEPGGEGLQVAQLRQLLHGVQEHLLGQFLRLGGVAQAGQRDRVDGGLEALDQLAVGRPVAVAGPQNNSDQLLLSHQGPLSIPIQASELAHRTSQRKAAKDQLLWGPLGRTLSARGVAASVLEKPLKPRTLPRAPCSGYWQAVTATVRAASQTVS